MVKKVSTKKLDSLFSKIIRSVGKCHYCGSRDNLQCAHVVSRRYHQVRWLRQNAIALCARHHLKFTYDPIGWEVYITKSVMSPKALHEIKRKAQEIGKIDHQAIYEDLKKLEATLDKFNL